MGKDRLYFLTFISILLVFIASASLGVNYTVKINVNLLLESEIKSSELEVQKISDIINEQNKLLKDQKEITNKTKELIEVVASGNTFIALLDADNKIAHHPKAKKTKKDVIISSEIQESVKRGLDISKVYNILNNYKKELDKNSQTDLIEIIHEKPLKNTNLKMVSVIDLDNLLLGVAKLERRLYTIFILMGVLIITISFFTVRFIGSFYEKELESKNIDIENDIISVTKLNLDVLIYQQKNEEYISKTDEDLDTDTDTKLRLLSYKGNEIIPTPLSSLSYIYTENSMTYIVDEQGKKSFSNSSLDEIYSDLDAKMFFRANRQFIINISRVEKIIKYGKSQLKIVIKNSDIEIVIKKNKVANFKQWLNK